MGAEPLKAQRGSLVPLSGLFATRRESGAIRAPGSFFCSQEADRILTDPGWLPFPNRSRRDSACSDFLMKQGNPLRCSPSERRGVGRRADASFCLLEIV